MKKIWGEKGETWGEKGDTWSKKGDIWSEKDGLSEDPKNPPELPDPASLMEKHRGSGKEIGRKRGKGSGNGPGTGDGPGGYFTVEASLVIPVVIGTIVFIVSVQLYLYDRCLMEQDTAMLALQSVKLYQGDMEETGSALREWMAENMTEKYMGYSLGNIGIAKTRDRIRVQRDGYLLTDHTPWRATSVYENSILRPSFFLRLCRRYKQPSSGA